MPAEHGRFGDAVQAGHAQGVDTLVWLTVRVGKWAVRFGGCGHAVDRHLVVARDGGKALPGPAGGNPLLDRVDGAGEGPERPGEGGYPLM